MRKRSRAKGGGEGRSTATTCGDTRSMLLALSPQGPGARRVYHPRLSQIPPQRLRHSEEQHPNRRLGQPPGGLERRAGFLRPLRWFPAAVSRAMGGAGAMTGGPTRVSHEGIKRRFGVENRSSRRGETRRAHANANQPRPLGHGASLLGVLRTEPFALPLACCCVGCCGLEPSSHRRLPLDRCNDKSKTGGTWDDARRCVVVV